MEYSFENERHLVAWVLLSRFSQHVLDDAWVKHGKTLSGFAKRLIRTDGVTSQNEQQLLVYHVRLLSHVCSRLEPSSERDDLLRGILKTWEYISLNWKIDEVLQLQMNIDAGNALFVMCAERVEVDEIRRALDTMWTIFSQIVLERSSKEARMTESSDREDLLQTNFEDMEQIMKMLLESNLTKPHLGDCCDSDFYSPHSWDKLVLGFFDMHHMAVNDARASKVLKYVSTNHQKLSREQKFGWHEWLMQYVANRCSLKSPFMALRDADMVSAMQQILLAHVVSPDDQALRSIAWQTVSAMIKRIGWKLNNASSTNSSICLWTRLSSGEWKLQLEKSASSLPPDNAILCGCGQILISAVQFLVQFDDNPDQSIPLDAAALLHLKESLEGAFTCSSEYLATLQQLHFEPIVAVVWHTIFPELELDTTRSLETVVAALKKLLEEPVKELREETLLRSLIHIQSTAEVDGRVHNLIRPIEKLISCYIEKLSAQYSALQVSTSDLSENANYTDQVGRSKPLEQDLETQLGEATHHTDCSPEDCAVRSRKHIKEKWASRRKHNDKLWDPPPEKTGTPVMGVKIEAPNTKATLQPLCLLLRRSWNDAIKSLIQPNAQYKTTRSLPEKLAAHTKRNEKRSSLPSVLSILHTSAMNRQIETMQSEGDEALNLYPAEFDFSTTIDKTAKTRSRAFLLLDFSSIIQAHTIWRKKMPRKGVQFTYSTQYNANPKLLQLLLRLGVALQISTKYDLELLRSMKLDKIALLEDPSVTEKPPSFYRSFLECDQQASQQTPPLVISTISDLERVNCHIQIVARRRNQNIPRLRLLLKLDRAFLVSPQPHLEQLCSKARSLGHEIVGFIIELLDGHVNNSKILDDATNFMNFSKRGKFVLNPEIHIILSKTATEIEESTIDWIHSHCFDYRLVSIDVTRLLLTNAAALCARVIGVKKSGKCHMNYYIDDGCYGSLATSSKDAIPIPLRKRDLLAEVPVEQLQSTVWGPTCK
jgi:Pyridoxal-dependent decarboxylase, C-terminal sheet domain